MSMIENMSEISSTKLLQESSKRYNLIHDFLNQPKKFNRKQPSFNLSMETELKKVLEALCPNKGEIKASTSMRDIGKVLQAGKSQNFKK